MINQDEIKAELKSAYGIIKMEDVVVISIFIFLLLVLLYVKYKHARRYAAETRRSIINDCEESCDDLLIAYKGDPTIPCTSAFCLDYWGTSICGGPCLSLNEAPYGAVVYTGDIQDVFVSSRFTVDSSRTHYSFFEFTCPYTTLTAWAANIMDFNFYMQFFEMTWGGYNVTDNNGNCKVEDRRTFDGVFNYIKVVNEDGSETAKCAFRAITSQETDAFICDPRDTLSTCPLKDPNLKRTIRMWRPTSIISPRWGAGKTYYRHGTPCMIRDLAGQIAPGSYGEGFWNGYVTSKMENELNLTTAAKASFDHISIVLSNDPPADTENANIRIDSNVYIMFKSSPLNSGRNGYCGNSSALFDSGGSGKKTQMERIDSTETGDLRFNEKITFSGKGNIGTQYIELCKTSKNLYEWKKGAKWAVSISHPFLAPYYLPPGP
jgi:hypothetical protein